MSVGIFTEKRCPPKEREISASLGSSLGMWNDLNEWMIESISAQHELKYMYGQKYGWARRFQLRGELLAALYPNRCSFTAQVILGRTSLERTIGFKLGKNAQSAIERAHLYAEGKWLFIPVESQRDVEDVKRLVNLKLEEARIRGGKRLPASASHC